MLAIDLSDSDPIGNESVILEGKVIGNTTSGCFSPTLGQGLAYAYLPAFAANPGLEMAVDLVGDLRPAKVLDAPPVMAQPNRERLSRAAKDAQAVNAKI